MCIFFFFFTKMSYFDSTFFYDTGGSNPLNFPTLIQLILNPYESLYKLGENR